MQKLAVIITLLLSLTLQPGYANNSQVSSGSVTPDTSSQPANNTQKITALAWQYQGSVDYEKDVPGYGTGYQFISRPNAFIDVYRYDMGKKNWLEGIDDPYLINILDIAKNEINRQLKKGAYLQADFTELTQTTIAGQDFYVQPVYLETDQHQMTSFIYLSVLNQRLLKFRISYITASASYDIEQINRQFIEETINGLKQFE